MPNPSRSSKQSLPEPPKKQSSPKASKVAPQCCKPRPAWKASRDLGGVFHWERERKAVAKMYIEMYDDQGRPKHRDESVSSTDTTGIETCEQQRPQACQRETSSHQIMSVNTSSTTLVGSERWSVTPSERTQHDHDERLHVTTENEHAVEELESKNVRDIKAQWEQFFPRVGYVDWNSTEPGHASYEVQGPVPSPRGNSVAPYGAYFGEISWMPETHLPRSDDHLLRLDGYDDSNVASTESTSTLKPERPRAASRASKLSFRKTHVFEATITSPGTTQHLSVWKRSTKRISMLLPNELDDGRFADIIG